MRGRALRASGRALAALALAVSIGGSADPAAPAAAQERDGGTVALGDLSWLAGTWRGEGPGGSVAEIHFLPPEAGVLPSLFRLWRGEEVLVLEAISLVATEGELTMYVRHFDPALVPLETEGALELRLVSSRGDSLVFENVQEGVNPRRSVMTRTEGGFVARSELDRPDGSVDEIRVEYRRAGPAYAGASDDGPRYSERRLDEGILEWTAVLEAPVARVWDAFTEESSIEGWMVPVAEVDLRIGGLLRTNYDAEAGIGGPGTIEAEILAFDPRRMLALKTVTVPENAPFAEPIRDAWSVTWFEPLGPERTRLTMRSLGWGEGPDWDRAREFFRDGNLWSLRQLERFVEGEEAGDPGR